MPAFVHDRSPHVSFPPPPPSQFLRSLPMDLTLSPPLSPSDSDPHGFLPSFHGPHDPAYQLLHDDLAHPHSNSYPPSPSHAFLRGCTPYPASSPSNIRAFNASLDYGLLFCAEQNVDGIAACCAFPRTSLMQHPCSCNSCSFGCPTESVCASEPMNQNEEMTLARSWPAIDHFNDDFRMYDFKVKRCMRGRSHDWTECPFAHPGEKARRRDPRRIRYSGTPCPDFRKGACKRGDACEFAHGVFECWLHPARYRTQPCKDGENCKRRVCFFAHTSKQLRQPSESSIGSVSDVPPTSSSQSNRLRFGTSALVERSPRQRPMIDRLMVLERSNGDEPADTIDTLLGPNGYEDGRDVPFDDSSLSYVHLKAGHLALKGTTQYMKEDFGFLSPTSTLVRHPYSPPLSPLQSPSSHSTGFGRLAPGTTCAPHSFPSSRFIEESIHGAKDLDCLSASFSNMELMGLQKDPDLQVQGFQSEYTHVCSPRIPSSQQGSGWGNRDVKLETAARGQDSGEALRAEVFNKICKENVDNQMPDLGWVSELVK